MAGLKRNTEPKHNKEKGDDTMCNIVENDILFSISRDTKPLEVTREALSLVLASLVHQ